MPTNDGLESTEAQILTTKSSAKNDSEEFQDSIKHPNVAAIRAVDEVRSAGLETIGCCMSAYVADLNSLPDPLACFRLHAQKCLKEFAEGFGMKGVTFEVNLHALPASPLYEAFTTVIKDSSLSEKSLALVFHGTSSDNIQHILENGLDPTMRRGQAYGPGEYFSKDPAVSVSYTRGGSDLIVFCVVTPIPDPELKIPINYVVVSENTHQLPLGTLRFTSVDRAAIERSNRMQAHLLSLHRAAEEKQRAANEAQRKALVIQLLIQQKADLAEEKYHKYIKSFSYSTKREISMYVYKILDAAVVDCLFPGLPEPFSTDEFDVNSDLKTVEEQEKEALQAIYEAQRQGAQLAVVTPVLSGGNSPSAPFAKSLIQLTNEPTTTGNVVTTSTRTLAAGFQTSNGFGSAPNPMASGSVPPVPLYGSGPHPMAFGSAPPAPMFGSAPHHDQF